ncbi:MAG: alanine--tRNA ligase, partial [Candidatus Moraniibacteriota bacterium]
TTAGMQPLVPYLLGENHPQGKRLANVQKCVRLTDIDEVGDVNHVTFFEMLGNWSLGDYFKKDSIEWSFEFLTSTEHGLGIDPGKIYISVFSGDEVSLKDTESIGVWKSVYAKAGIDARVYGEEDLNEANNNLKPSYRIYLLGKEDNWWPSGGKNPGPQGPDTEIFYYWGKSEPDPEKERPGFNDDNFWEIWNNVFMEYNRKNGGFSPLLQKNVDTGMGLERITAALQGKQDVFQSDLYAPIIKILEYESNREYGKELKITRAMRIIADHLRTAVFILGDDARVTPSNLGKGYVLRRLIRRSLRYQKMLDIDGENKNFLEQLARTIVENYAEAYPELGRNFNYILEELKSEQERFEKTLEKGMKEWEKIASFGKISGEEAFNLFSTYGFPLELTEELAQENKITVDKVGFQQAFEKHQKISRDGAEKRFKGGLIDDSYETTKLHTATHLLQAALRAVLGPDVTQKGSNITPDRLRFDFSHPGKLTGEEKKKVEELVNNAIQSRLPVEVSEMKYAEAIQKGAIGVFEKKYGDKVKVFTIGRPDQPFSREICGGPHVKNTSELGKFKILKEEAVSAGVRRIKAILE